jgi:hypothetical protein
LDRAIIPDRFHGINFGKRIGIDSYRYGIATKPDGDFENEPRSPPEMAQVVLQPIETVDCPSHYRTDTPLPVGRLKGIVETTVASVFGVDLCQLRAESRGQAQVALARQVAMYLMHCAFGVSLTDIGHIFCRDRTTASYACKIVEDRRDEPTFDYILSNLEEIVRHRAKLSIRPAVS